MASLPPPVLFYSHTFFLLISLSLSLSLSLSHSHTHIYTVTVTGPAAVDDLSWVHCWSLHGDREKGASQGKQVEQLLLNWISDSSLTDLALDIKSLMHVQSVSGCVCVPMYYEVRVVECYLWCCVSFIFFAGKFGTAETHLWGTFIHTHTHACILILDQTCYATWIHVVMECTVCCTCVHNYVVMETLKHMPHSL